LDEESALLTWNYDSAFSRNRGLIQPDEQQCLRQACVAIAGLGGVGGVHLVTLLRLGICRFHLADPDQFELPNMNRQYGADMSTLGKSKLEVMAAVARRINPDVELTLFSDGLTAQNCDAFFRGADVAVDGIDFFAIEARRLAIRCTPRSRPAPPIAPGAVFIIFTAGFASPAQRPILPASWRSCASLSRNH